MPAIYALNEWHILEALRRQVDHPRTGPLVQGVDGDRAPQDQERYVVDVYAGAGQSVEDTLLGVCRCRGPFGDYDLVSVFLHADQVGEGAPGVDPYSYAHLWHASCGNGGLPAPPPSEQAGSPQVASIRRLVRPVYFGAA